MTKIWEIISREEVLDSQWYRVFKESVRLPSGRVLDDYFVRDCINSVLIVPRLVDGNFLMTKQYKHGARKVVLEFPAGRIDDDEDVVSAAKRELREEAGADAIALEMGPVFFDDPTNSRGKTFIVFAEGVRQIYQQKLDENEDIQIVSITRQELQQSLLSGLLQVAASVAAGYMAVERQL